MLNISNKININFVSLLPISKRLFVESSIYWTFKFLYRLKKSNTYQNRIARKFYNDSFI